MALDMIPRETRDLRDEILGEARARGIDLQQESLVVEQNLTVLRLRVEDRVLRAARIRLLGAWGSNEPDVVTVLGAAHRSSRMWPRRLDGSFQITAIVDHLLALLREEREHPRARP